MKHRRAATLSGARVSRSPLSDVSTKSRLSPKGLDAGVREGYYSSMATKRQEEYLELKKQFNELTVKYEVACDTIDKLQAQIALLLPNLHPA